MAMSHSRAETIRTNSRTLGILFNVIALLSVVAAVLAALAVVRFGSEVRVSANDVPRERR